MAIAAARIWYGSPRRPTLERVYARGSTITLRGLGIEPINLNLARSADVSVIIEKFERIRALGHEGRRIAKLWAAIGVFLLLVTVNVWVIVLGGTPLLGPGLTSVMMVALIGLLLVGALSLRTLYHRLSGELLLYEQKTAGIATR